MANVRALTTLALLDREERAATPEEQQVLAAWSGWGALPTVFAPKPADYKPGADPETRAAAIRWQALEPARQELRELLSEEEWADARRNTLNAHYTSPALATAMWEGLRRLGFDGGHVLEPGSGSGNFIGLAPPDTTVPVEMTGVEVEGKTAGIARRLYPHATVVTAGFEDVAFTDGAFDAVVGNIPYGRYQRYDKVHNKDLKLSIHDHFVYKSLALTRPGGIVALITSRYTLDGRDSSARERMYELGDLVGAVRLPAGAHREAAGTDVVTDVLFLRRRAAGETPGDTRWLTASEQVLPGVGEPVVVNDYITAHPQYVLGELRTRIGPFGPEVTVAGERDAAAGLAEAADAIAVAARASGLTATAAAGPGESRTASAPPRPLLATEYLNEGALGLDAEGRPTIVEDGRPVELEVHPEQRERLVQLIGLKARTLALYEAEAASTQVGETAQLAEMRTELREAYRAYRKTNPPPGKPGQRRIFTPKEATDRAALLGLASVPDQWKATTAFAFIDDDPDASLLFGLEVWDDRTGKATEQKVLHERVLEPRQIPDTAQTPEDAVALAMEWDGGRLDMSRVASLLGVEEDEAALQVGHLAFRDPAQNGFWEPAARYLSGNVREKLKLARASAAEDPAYDPNVGALERVQPEDLTPAEIKARCGAPWIPVEDYRAFLNHLGFEHAEVRHAGGTLWEVRGAHVGDLARSEWGTPERSAQDLVLSILRQADSTIQVTYRDNEGKTQVNQQATDAAREKARLIREAWDDWIWADPARSERLAGIYNETFNALVLPEYDTSPLTLPGVGDWKMRPHQNAAIRRILSEPTALLAHVVGAGKTATMVGGVMELRRTGLARKPAIVIPNHMLRQITREFREIYPNAKLLAISASDLNVKRRAKFMARVAGGDWDAVVMTHEAFNRVPLRPETQLAYIDSEIGSLREQLDEASAAGMHERTIKQIENDLAAVEARMLKQVDDSASGAGVFLEDTGIDYLMVDEAHGYKNLRTISAIPGAGIQGSVKATKLHMVLGHLRETNGSGRVCTLATGTPIANSVTEAYVLKRYLAPDLLEEQGLSNFDSWAATFGEVVSALEPDAKGDGYKYKARFSRFFNVPELMAAYRSFADVQTAEDLNLPTPPVLKGPDGQRGESIAFPVTGAQREFIRALPHQGWVREPGGVLKALGLGLRASLDMRLIGKDEEAGSKLPYAAEQIADIWRQTKDTVYPTSKDDPTPQKQPGGLQLVFLDEGTPGSTAANPVDLYDSLREQLVEQGVPRQEIRFIHEASTDRKKEKLFSDCRAGRVSVLVGSTEKLGTGTNIQDRCVALHHLSYPWRPADMAQRDGRVERQGNLNAPWIEGTPDHVRIIYYVTSGSFDEFRLNALARKAKFIAQIQRKDFSLREIEDIGEEALNLGMLSALASGDPAILQLAEATADRARMQGLARTWNRQQDSRVQTIKDLDEYIARATTTLAGMREAAPLRRPTAGDAFALTVDGRTLRGRDTAAAALGTRMVALARDTSLRPGERVPVGQLGGLPFHGEVSYDYSGRRQLKLRFAWGHTVPIGHRDDRAQWQATSVTESNARGAIVSLENFLTKLEEDADKLEREITTQRGHRTDAANNLRPYEDNPYSIQARSKEREEKLLSQLVIINEKKTTLAEKIEKAGGNALPADDDQLKEFAEKADELRALIGDEHAIQKRATDAQAQEAPATAQAAPGELPLVMEAATAENTPPAAGPGRERDGDRQQETGRDRVPVPGTRPAGENGPEPLLPDAADADSPESAPAPLAAGKRADTQAPPASTAPGAAREGDRWETAVRELTAGGLLDERVTTWARANDITNLAVPLTKWVDSHLSERWEDLDAEDWPEWVTQYFKVPAETRRAVVARVAEAIHAAVHQQQIEQAPAPGAPDSPEQGREMTVEEMVRHDAQAMADQLGGTAQVVTSDEFARMLGALSSAAPDDGEPALAADTDLWQEAVTAFTDAALADEALAIEARAQGPETFKETFRDWSEDWFTEHWEGVDVRPEWVEAYLHPEAWEAGLQLTDQVAADIYARARQKAALPSETAARNQGTQPPESRLAPLMQAALQAGDDSVTALLTSAGLADSTVTRWAREATPEVFGEQFVGWSRAWLTDLASQPDADNLPWLVRHMFRATAEQGERIAAAAAAAVHTLSRETTTDAPAPGAGGEAPEAAVEGAPVDPEVEAVRRVWLQSQDWWVKAAAEGRSGQRLHLASTPGYVLVERTSKVAEGWEVVPASGQRLKIGVYTGIASWDADERDQAEAFADRLDQALRGHDGAPFVWPVPRKWRSAEGYRLDRAIAEVRAAWDRERGIDSSPGIHQAALLADRDAQAQAAAEAKKAAAQAKRDAAKAAKKAAALESRPAPAPAPDQDTRPESSDITPVPTGDAGSARDIPAAGAQQPESGREVKDAVGEERDEVAEQVDAGDQLDVITPDGPGRLASLNGDVALVDTEAAGARIYHRSEIYRPGQPDAPLINPAELAKRRQNEADAAQASTPAGIVMRYPHYRRLRDLDVEAGHGTIAENMVVDWDGNVHEPGEVVGWVRARIGDDGKRYWWGQDALGGPPDDMPFHENLPAKSGHPAIRAAGTVRTDMKPSSMTRRTRPVLPPYAVREIRLTTAQVALLRTLPLVGTYPDGSELPTPPWVGEHRRYVMSVAQMQALRLAAEAAADSLDTSTTVGRRSRKVLLNAADRLHFEEYETGRRGASIPPIGEVDPYAGPYTPPPPRAEPEPVEEAPPAAEADDAVLGQEQPAPARAPQPAVPAEQTPQEQPLIPSQEAAVEDQDQDQAELPGLEDVGSDSTRSAPAGVPGQPRDEPAPAAPDRSSTEPDTPESTTSVDSTPVPEAAGASGTTGPGDDQWTYAPQDRVFHDAMRYVVASVSPDGTSIRTITGQDLPVAEVVAEADMPPVITEDLAEGWWRYTYEGRSYTATTLPPDLARTHPTAVLNTVIVDADGRLVGRAFGRPHESAIIWADAHPGVPHPHVAEWLGSAPTPWPDHTPAEIAHIAAGPPPAEDDLADEQPAPQHVVSGEPGEQSANRATAGTQPATPSAPDPQETPATEIQPDGPQDAAGTDTGQEAGPDGTDSRNDAEEYDMALPDATDLDDAPVFEDPPEPERYTETTPLADPEYNLWLHGWDGQPVDSGVVYRGDTAVAAVRPSAGGGWFARLTADGLHGDVTPLVASPAEAAHDGAVYYSVLTGTSYGQPLPDAEATGPLTRADAVRTAVRDTASLHATRITNASARAWPETYGSHPQLQHLVGTLFAMRDAVLDTAGARRMAADMEAVVQAAADFRSTLPEDPATAERQHMAFPIGHLLYDVRRLQDHLQRAVAASLAEQAAANERQEQAAAAAVGPDEAPAQEELQQSVPPAVAPESPAEAEPEPAAAPAPEPDLALPLTGPEAADTEEAQTAPAPRNEEAAPPQEPDRRQAAAVRSEPEAEPEQVPEPAEPGQYLQGEPEPQRSSEIIVLPYDSSYTLHLSGPDGQAHDYGELRAGDEAIGEVFTTADGWHGRSLDFDVPPGTTLAADTPLQAAHDTVLLISALTGRPYGEAPVAAEDTPQLTRAEVLRAEMSALATRHRRTLSAAAGRAWPDGMAFDFDHSLHQDKLARSLGVLEAAVEQAPAAWEMVAQLVEAQQSALLWLDRVNAGPAEVSRERQHMAFPLASLVHDISLFDQRLAATAEAVQAERAAAAQQAAAAERPVPQLPEQPAAVPEPDPAPEAVLASAEPAVPEAQAPAAPLTATSAVPAPADGNLNSVPTEAEGPVTPAPAAAAGSVAPEATSPEPSPEPQDMSAGIQVDAGPHDAGPEADLPLWTGPETGTDGPLGDTDPADSEIFANTGALQEAWESAVLANGGTAHDLVAALEDELNALQRSLSPAAAPETDTAGEGTTAVPVLSHMDRPQVPGARRDPGAVNAALAAADQHLYALREAPEWQELQTVRGATRNLWEAIKRQTGASFKQFMEDDRVQAWWKQVSIRVCERIANLAMRTADRLRGDAPEPAACMDRLHEAADDYSRPDGPPRGSDSDLQKQMRKLEEGMAAAQVKVDAARSRSTTIRKPKVPRPAAADQPGHLRRTTADPKRGPRQGR
ncbi:DEAD/DEAH box helicase family protein [Streptomyces sp. ZAF1911]|uniref:Eco57I restriction-modification methylase domain-containing protein n=1 Tax=Streptomyces sp. ZAF1911 TaxID=2944129 RepID=UPI00237C51E0|nr:DEAD/DEAH box helicase family protein [Streptomyces sp. ZAF1911]MDD9383122.1 DEAD/DEAH box helicase family protein [Streptomyces sp. ZAF1911]